MGMVDLSNLTWEQFWIGVAYLLTTGSLASLGVVRLFQQYTRTGIMLLGAAGVLTVIFFVFISDNYFKLG